MKKINQTTLWYLSLAGLVLFTWISGWTKEYFDWNDSLHNFFKFAKDFGYISFYLVWVAFVWNRILHPQTRRILMGIGLLAVFWIVVRMLKWHIVRDPVIIRNLWYLYYLPRNLIAALFLLASVSIGQREEWKIPWMWWLVPAAALLLAAGMAANDFHQQGFRFLTPVWDEVHIHYGWLYWDCVVQESACIVGGLWLMFHKCRLPQARTIMLLPFAPMVFLALYCIGYGLNSPFILWISRDMTAVNCLCFVLTMELCIVCGLIRSNSRYEELFRASSLNAFITDEDYQIQFSSMSTNIPGMLERRLTETAPVIFSQGQRLLQAPIAQGHVLWTEDISDLMDVLQELEDVSEKLESRQNVLQKEYETDREKSRKTEKNRLYNRLMTKLEPDIREYACLIDQLEKETDPAGCEWIVFQIMLICTYIKRRANILFLDESSDSVPEQELEYCLEETMSILRLKGMNCGFFVQPDLRISWVEIGLLYESVYHCIRQNLDRMEQLFITVAKSADKPSVLFRLNCEPVDTPDLCLQDLEQEEEEWVFKLQIHPEAAL